MSMPTVLVLHLLSGAYQQIFIVFVAFCLVDYLLLGAALL
ncbi:hypothetical protein DSUL_100148 [Desulfovibrionales bacterium]